VRASIFLPKADTTHHGAFQITSRKHHYKKQRTSLHQIPQVRQIKKFIQNRRNAGMEDSRGRKYDTHHCPARQGGGGGPAKSSAASAVFQERFTHDTCAVLRLAHLCCVGNTVLSQMIWYGGSGGGGGIKRKCKLSIE
jgi:hypothetical protein